MLFSARYTCESLPILLFFVLNMADVMTTIAGLRAGGVEGDPLGAWLFTHYGEYSLYLFKGLTMVLAWGAVAWKPKAILGIQVTNIILALVVLNNTLVVRR